MVLTFSAAAQADRFTDKRRLTAQVAPYTHHYRHDSDHENFTRLLGLEFEFRPDWIAGAAAFRNSFSQQSQYIYGGKRWPLPRVSENAYFKLSAGLLLGYRRPYDDKIPFNRNGIALAAVPAFGYQYERVNVQFNILGTAGFILSFGVDLLTWD